MYDSYFSEQNSTSDEMEELTPIDRCLHCCLQTVISQWALLATFGTIGLALIYPDWGASVYKPVSVSLIVALFFIIGFNLNLAELRRGVLAVHFHAVFQVYSLVATPLLYYCLCFKPRWPENCGILTHNFAVGTMAAMCMPTTTNTGPIFALQAGGDQSVASVNAALGNVLGPFVAPAMAGLLLNSDVGTVDAGKTLKSLLEEILLPLFCGLLLQVGAARWRPGLHSRGRSAGKLLSPMLLVTLFYFIFCKAFGGGAHGLSLTTVVKLTGWCISVFLCNLALTIPLAWRFGSKRFVSFIISAPQKTESLGVALLTLIFSNQEAGIGELTFPVVCYHTIQLIIGAMLLPLLSRVANRQELDVQHRLEDDAIIVASEPHNYALEEPLVPVASAPTSSVPELLQANRCR